MSAIILGFCLLCNVALKAQTPPPLASATNTSITASNSSESINNHFTLFIEELENEELDFEEALLNLDSTNQKRLLKEIYESKPDSKLRRSYMKEVNKNLHLPETNFELFTGTFIPNWQLDFLGTHPEIGISAGIEFPKMSYKFIMSARTGKSKDRFVVSDNSNIYASNDFFGSYFGLQAGAKLYANSKVKILATATTGYDRFTTLITQEADHQVLVEADGITFSPGVNFAFKLKKQLFFSIGYQYNIANYKSDNIVNNIEGNYHTLRISIGGQFDTYKHEKLKMLGYNAH